jgi:hypothetical protein
MHVGLASTTASWVSCCKCLPLGLLRMSVSACISDSTVDVNVGSRGLYVLTWEFSFVAVLLFYMLKPRLTLYNTKQWLRRAQTASCGAPTLPQFSTKSNTGRAHPPPLARSNTHFHGDPAT